MLTTKEWLYRPRDVDLRLRATLRPLLDLGWVGFTTFIFEFLTPEDGADSLSRNVGKNFAATRCVILLLFSNS
jgi:hypothetical protein